MTHEIGDTGINDPEVRHLSLLMFSRASGNPTHGQALFRATAMLAAFLASHGDDPDAGLETVLQEHAEDARNLLREMQRLCGDIPHFSSTERTIQ